MRKVCTLRKKGSPPDTKVNLPQVFLFDVIIKQFLGIICLSNSNHWIVRQSNNDISIAKQELLIFFYAKEVHGSIKLLDSS